jgi:uncharacterized protein
VRAALSDWALEAKQRHAGLLHLGYFGSYARGDWGVGSDLDLVAVVADDPRPFENRTADWDYHRLPVPADLLVYTLEEWQRMAKEKTRFQQTLQQETVWLDIQGPSPYRL